VNPLFTSSLAKGNTQKKEPKQNEIKVKGKIRQMRDIKVVQMFILLCLKNKGRDAIWLHGPFILIPIPTYFRSLSMEGLYKSSHTVDAYN
jgi:hypothetical protein